MAVSPTGAGRGAIRGQVRDAAGRPVAEAVVLIAEGPSHPDIAAQTGANGEYSFTGLGPGTYTVLVNAAEREPQRDTVEVTTGEARLDFVLP